MRAALVVAALFAWAAHAQGLSAQLYRDKTLTELVEIRTDAAVDFTWYGSPGSMSVPADNFSVRWSGYLTPRYSETYTFKTVSDDGVRLWVNGVQKISNWTAHGWTENISTGIALKAGQKYTVKLEYYDATEEGVIKLSWRSKSQPEEVIPASALTPSAALASCKPPPIEPPPVTPPPVPLPPGWMRTEGSAIIGPDGARWAGRGANTFDTRSCNACAYQAPSIAEVKRRIDYLAARGATFHRLLMESYATSGGRTHWANVLADPAYGQDLKAIVDYAASKGVTTLLSLWIDPTIDSAGRPTPGTGAVWSKLATIFADTPSVMFGVVNEPESNFDGAEDALVWQAMNTVVAAIRATEDGAGKPRHLVAVQGTRAWARDLSYYVTHPITAGGGSNIVYETHVYNPPSDWQSQVWIPSATLPVLVGEFGPDGTYMTQAAAQQFMGEVETHRIPYAGWALHARCPPNLLVDTSGNAGCGIGMTLSQTVPWGQSLFNFWAAHPLGAALRRVK